MKNLYILFLSEAPDEASETQEKANRDDGRKKQVVRGWIESEINSYTSVSQIKDLQNTLVNIEKYDVLKEEIRRKVEQKRLEDADITNDTIDEEVVNRILDDEKDVIIRKIQNTLLKRELSERALEKKWKSYTICNAENEVLDDEAIKDLIENIETDELEELAKDMKKSTRYLLEFNSPKAPYTLITQSFQDFMEDVGVSLEDLKEELDEKDYKALRHQMAVFEGTGDADSDVLQLFFKGIKDLDKKKKALKKIMPTISLQDARRYGLITVEKEMQLLEEMFWDYIKTNNLNLQLEEDTLEKFLEAGGVSELKTQRQHHRDAFLKKASESTKDIYIDIQDFDILDDDGDFETRFNTLTPLMAATLLNQVKDHNSNTDETAEVQVSDFDSVKSYLENQDLPSFTEGAIGSLTKGSYIRTQISTEEESDPIIRTWKIAETNYVNPSTGEKWIQLVSYDNIGRRTSMEGEGEFVSYQDFAKNFAVEMKMRCDFGKAAITSERPEFTQESIIHSRSDFLSLINSIDTEGIHQLENGMAFSFNTEDDKKEVAHIENINDDQKTITVIDKWNNDDTRFTLSWTQFIALIEKEKDDKKVMNFKRLGSFSMISEFVQNTSLQTDIEYKNGKIVYSASDRDENGNEKEQEKELKCLMNSKGEFIYIERADSGLVTFIHAKNKKEKDTQKDAQGNEVLDKKGKTKEVINLNKDGTPQQEKVKYAAVSYEYLEEFIQNGYTNVSDAIPAGKNTQDEEAKKHKKSSFLWGVFTEPGSFYSKYLAIKMGIWKIKSNQEQKAQVEAAEAMHRWAKRLPANSNLRYQFITEYSHVVSGEINKKMEEISRLGAKEKRERIRKVLLSQPPQWYELFAALIVTVQMSGDLYPDAELSPLRGEKYLWFTALARVMGLDPAKQLADAKGDLVKEYESQKDHPPETALITRLFKRNNDNAFVTAIGSGGKYWWAVQEGIDKQRGKWEKETAVLGGAKEAKEYAMWKLKKDELACVAGAIPQIHDKDPSAEYMSPAFVWAMGNVTNMARGDISKNNVMIENLVKKWSGFHSFCFSASPADAKKYQDAVKEVVKYLARKGKISKSDANGFEALYQKVQNNPNIFDKDLLVEIGAFWDKHYAVLHPALQGNTPELFLMLEDEQCNTSVVRDYIDQFDAMISYKFTDSKGIDLGGVAQWWGYSPNSKGSAIFQLQGKGSNLKSLNHILGACPISGHNLTMDGMVYNHVWVKQIVNYVKLIRNNDDFSANPDYQKRQYKAVMKEIIQMLQAKSKEPHHAEEMFNDAIDSRRRSKENYFDDLKDLGVEIRDYTSFVRGDSDEMAEAAYEKFMKMKPETSERIISKSSILADRIIDSGKMGEAVNDPYFEEERNRA